MDKKLKIKWRNVILFIFFFSRNEIFYLIYFFYSCILKDILFIKNGFNIAKESVEVGKESHTFSIITG